MMEKKAAFIGAGNMGGAVAEAVCKAVQPSQVVIYDPSAQSAERLREKTGCCVASSGAEAANAAKYIFLCVKPQIFKPVLDELLDRLEKGGEQVLVSIAASVPLDAIRAQVREKGADFPVVRLLPNTPVSVGQGLFLMSGGPEVPEEVYEELAGLLAPGGMVERTSEHTMDVACPVYSCSPAFACMFIEGLSDGAVQIGLPRDKAIRYAAQAILGAAALVLETGQHPGELKDAVCSPGGTTIAGVTTLENHGFRAASAQAVIQAYTRMKELEG